MRQSLKLKGINAKASRKAKRGEDYFKWEVILSKEAVKKAGFKEGDKLEESAEKNKIVLRKKAH